MVPDFNLEGIAIAGYDESEVGIVPNKSTTELYVDAMLNAISNAGLKPSDIDGVISGNSMVEHYRYHAEAMAEYIGLDARYCLTLNTGGGTTASALTSAAAAINSGAAECIVVAFGESMRSGFGPRAVEMIGAARGANHPDYEAPYGQTVPSLYALIGTRHMHEYGTKPEHFAAVAVTMRENASRNPKAQKRDIITIDDVLSSPLVASPLRRLDCSLISDGAGALVVTSLDRARDLPGTPVRLLGIGQAYSHHHITTAPSLTTFGSRVAGSQAFSMAKLSHDDIDLIGIYDAFTPCVVVTLEDLGFCKPGEGGPFVADGNIAMSGRFPVNPHGGLLSCAHPGRPGGIFTLGELVRQLREEAGERQLQKATTAIAALEGGIMSSHGTVIIQRDER